MKGEKSIIFKNHNLGPSSRLRSGASLLDRLNKLVFSQHGLMGCNPYF